MTKLISFFCSICMSVKKLPLRLQNNNERDLDSRLEVENEPSLQGSYTFASLNRTPMDSHSNLPSCSKWVTDVKNGWPDLHNNHQDRLQKQ